MAPLDRPICIIGAARSGTTLLAEILERHPDVAYWVEPKYVWRYRDPRASDDVRRRSDATPAVTRYIRGRFARFAAERGKPRFMEKTPSNCYRIPFVDAVLPDARYVHILRDGRDVTRSAIRKWTSPPDPSALKRRLTSFEVPLRDLPFYGVDALRDMLGRQVLPERAFVWGPQFPGIRAVRDEQGPEVACALQWRTSVEAALEGLAEVPPERQTTLRFEDLVSDPEAHVKSLLDFLQLDPSETVLSYARAEVRPDAAQRAQRDPAPDDWDPYLRPLLSDLGYD